MPKVDNDRHAELLQQNWIPLREPQNIATAMIGSLPFLILSGLITFYIIHLISPFSFKELGFSEGGLVIQINFLFVVAMFLMLIIHELIHLAFVPNFLKSNRTYIGLTWFGGYVFTEEIIPKRRYLWISLAPFVLISIVLPIILGIFGVLTTSLKILLLLNALGSSVDLLGVCLILFQVPAHAQLVSNGMITYWKKNTPTSANTASSDM